MSADAVLTTTRRPAMGAEVEITTDVSPVAISAALHVVARLEQRWTRFSDDNELAMLNAADGPALARASTARVIEVALAGRTITRGWFDPTRGTDVRAAGYEHASQSWVQASERAPRGGEVEIDGDTGLVHIPVGVEIDLGGIAKGWASDVAATLLRERGASHAGVAVGGDVRVCSDTPALVEVASPACISAPPAIVSLRDGGVAVSGPTKRRTADGRHHLVDPFTGRPARHPRVAVVIAAAAAGAEMLATAAAIAPSEDAVDIISSVGATAWLIEPDGALTAVGEPDRFLLESGWLAQPSGRRWTPRASTT